MSIVFKIELFLNNRPLKKRNDCRLKKHIEGELKQQLSRIQIAFALRRAEL